MLDRSKHPAWAQLVARAMGATVDSRPDSSRYLDVTVLLGADWRPPPSRSTRSCPHAAAMSMPRLFLIATSTPFARTARAKP